MEKHKCDKTHVCIKCGKGFLVHKVKCNDTKRLIHEINYALVYNVAKDIVFFLFK